MNLSGECVGHRTNEKLLWGQGAGILPPARPLSAAVQTFLGSGARPSCTEAAGRASAARGQGNGSSPLSLTVAEEPGRG